jgi:hypothetical protein
MIQSDDICEAHKGSVVGQAAATNLILGAATLGLSGAGAVVAGEAAHMALSAAATGTAGARSLVNEEVYQQKFVGVLIDAVEISRNEKRKEILQHYGEPLEKYSIDDGIRDVQDYHQRCSFYHGLVILADTIQARREEDRKARGAAAKQNLDALEEEVKTFEKDAADVQKMAAGKDKNAAAKALATMAVNLEDRIAAQQNRANEAGASDEASRASSLWNRVVKAAKSAQQ